jgi:hypothetical protein
MRHRHDEKARLASEAAQRELEDCTFRPRINAASIAITRGRRRSLSSGAGRSAGLGANAAQPTSLSAMSYGGASASPPRTAARGSSSGGGGVGSIHDRLYHAATSARVPTLSGGTAGLGVLDPAAALLATAAGTRTPVGAGGGSMAMKRPHSAGPMGSGARYLQGGRPLFTSQATGSPKAAQPLNLAAAPAQPWEEQAMRECTFQPRINAPYDARPVQSR